MFPWSTLNPLLVSSPNGAWKKASVANLASSLFLPVLEGLTRGYHSLAKCPTEKLVKDMPPTDCTRFRPTPEMIAHTCVGGPETLNPVEPKIWEQYEWPTLPENQSELVVSYIKTAGQMRLNLDFSVEGVTSLAGFGACTLPFYARVTGEEIREIQATPPLTFSNGFQWMTKSKSLFGTLIKVQADSQ